MTSNTLSDRNENDGGNLIDGELRSALSDDRVHPGERFFQQIQDAPWNRKEMAVSWRWAGASLALVIVFGAVFFTSSGVGRTLAASIFRFFNAADGVTETMPAVLYEVTPGAPAPTPTPQAEVAPAFSDQCGDLSQPRCTLAEIQPWVSFPILDFSEPIYQARFTGATGDAGFVWMEYTLGAGNQEAILIVVQELASSARHAWTISEDAQVEEVSVNDSPAEYVHGLWKDAGRSSWDAYGDADSLSWQDGEIRYSISLLGEPQAYGLASGSEGLVKLAESLRGFHTISNLVGRDANAMPPLPAQTDREYFTYLDDAMAGAGFGTAPVDLPVGYSFHHAEFDAAEQSLFLYYHYDDDEFPSLVLRESRGNDDPPLPDSNAPFYESQTVSVGGADGVAIYARGVQDLTSLYPDQDASYRAVLSWERAEVKYTLYAPGAVGMVPYFSRMDLIRLAESVTGVRTIDPGAVDPAHLTDANQAEELAGFDVLEPTRVPPGFSFSYATYQERDGVPTVSLIYRTGHISQYPLTQGVKGAKESLEALYPDWNTQIDVVKVNGVDAYYLQGCVLGSSEIDRHWEPACSQEMLYWDANGMVFQIQASISALEAKASLIGMAESMR